MVPTFAAKIQHASSNGELQENTWSQCTSIVRLGQHHSRRGRCCFKQQIERILNKIDACTPFYTCTTSTRVISLHKRSKKFWSTSKNDEYLNVSTKHCVKHPSTYVHYNLHNNVHVLYIEVLYTTTSSFHSDNVTPGVSYPTWTKWIHYTNRVTNNHNCSVAMTTSTRTQSCSSVHVKNGKHSSFQDISRHDFILMHMFLLRH